MDIVGKELVPGEGGMKEDDKNPQQRGGDAADVRLIFKAVAKAVLLFGSET